MTATLAELEARVAVLEAERADYKAVLATINALGIKLAGHQQQTRENLSGMRAKADDTNLRVRSIEENVAEVKDLLVRELGDT